MALFSKQGPLEPCAKELGGNINVVGYVNLKSNIQNLVLGLHTTLVHYNKHIYVRIRLIFSRRLG
jgi:hypothetical protein